MHVIVITLGHLRLHDVVDGRTGSVITIVVQLAVELLHPSAHTGHVSWGQMASNLIQVGHLQVCPAYTAKGVTHIVLSATLVEPRAVKWGLAIHRGAVDVT